MSSYSRSIRYCTLLVVVAALSNIVTASENPNQPNIVVVFIDDLGWGDLSCFGNDQVETENIDQLAREGLRFRQFYVNSPICSPSRVAITTGLYPQRCRIGSYLADRNHNQARGIANWLELDTPTLPRLLQSAGYATGHFGKWHMGGQRDVGDAPLITEYGFDESLTNFEGLGDRVIALIDREDGGPPAKHAMGSDQLKRGRISWTNRQEVTATFTKAAIEFIRRADLRDKPFYMNLWPDDVHTPLIPPTDRLGDGSKKARFLGVLDIMDEQLGELFAHIRNSDKLRGKTLIVVCSDNGPEKGAGTPGTLRGWKTQLYEGGIRSPLIVWGPGLVDDSVVGSTNDQSILAAFDLVPSLLSITGVEPPGGHRFDGLDLHQQLLGRSKADRNSPIMFRRPPDRDSFYGDKDLPDLAIRSGKWKLLCEYDGQNAQLYDLQNDPGEATNLVVRYPAITEDLTREVIRWHKQLPGDLGDSIEPKRNP